MDCYEELVDYAEQHGLEVIEKEFKSSAKGLCKGKKIGISKTIDSTVEKRCVLVEEMAHCYHTVGDILDTRNPLALKQELYARAAALEFLLPISKLVDAYLRCEHNLYELPEHLNVTWEFLDSALNHYFRKHGGHKKHGKYIIYFSPLFVCESSHTVAI